jgi:hypothetical protein
MRVYSLFEDNIIIEGYVSAAFVAHSSRKERLNLATHEGTAQYLPSDEAKAKEMLAEGIVPVPLCPLYMFLFTPVSAPQLIAVPLATKRRECFTLVPLAILDEVYGAVTSMPPSPPPKAMIKIDESDEEPELGAVPTQGMEPIRFRCHGPLCVANTHGLVILVSLVKEENVRDMASKPGSFPKQLAVSTIVLEGARYRNYRLYLEAPNSYRISGVIVAKPKSLNDGNLITKYAAMITALQQGLPMPLLIHSCVRGL